MPFHSHHPVMMGYKPLLGHFRQTVNAQHVVQQQQRRYTVVLQLVKISVAVIG